MSLTAIGAVHDLRIIFRGIDNVSNVADSIQSKVRALGGAIAALGGSGLLVTNLAEQFGSLGKKQAESLDKVLSLVAATGTLINVFARLAPAVLAAASAQNIMNAATAVADALAGPLGWALLAGAIAALAAWGLSQAIPGITRGQTSQPQQPAPAPPGVFQAGSTTGSPSGGAQTYLSAGPATGSSITIPIIVQGVTDPQQVALTIKGQLENLISKEMARRG